MAYGILPQIKWNIQSLSSEINLIRLFMLVFKRLMIKTLQLTLQLLQ